MALSSWPLSLEPARENKPHAFHVGTTMPGRGQLTSSAGFLGPSPGTSSSLCSGPLTRAAGGQHSPGSVLRATHHGPLSWRSTLSQEVQTPWEGSSRTPGLGYSSASRLHAS